MWSELLEVVFSPASQKAGDDAFGFRRVGNRIHLWVIDGATSLSDVPDKMITGLSDAAWFARSLAGQLHKLIIAECMNQGEFRRVVENLGKEYHTTGGRNAQPFEYPSAALTYAEFIKENNSVRVEIREYADCFYYIDYEEYGVRKIRTSKIFPGQIELPEKLTEPGLLEKLRIRRSNQILHLTNNVLSVNPASVDTVHCSTHIIDRPCEFFLGTDGFARLWCEYKLASLSSTFRRVNMHGALAEFRRLRLWEKRNQGHDAAPKAIDDATLLRLRLDPTGGNCNGHSDQGVLRISHGTLLWQSAKRGTFPASLLDAEQRDLHHL